MDIRRVEDLFFFFNKKGMLQYLLGNCIPYLRMGTCGPLLDDTVLKKEYDMRLP